MRNHEAKIIHEYVVAIGRKGGKARAAKYDRSTLSKWAKLGGRPKGSGKRKSAKRRVQQ